ncbi:endonuclease domain-containing protein [Acidihalobacter ferrooxydans]|uniref:endonuclease domain-containing protein n=1 Tax=Acidihalobacter ferrooxydans TaxID=1765967 RepID=UPI0018DE5263|nr:DUF559 domain-containing protein [Acidihalobacter ferrooxydans]
MSAALKKRFGSAVTLQYRGAVAGRRFVLDAAIVQALIAIEVDGWQHHGRFLSDFKRDREKDRALTLAGWRVLRFTAGEIRGDVQKCVQVIERALWMNR